MDKTLEASCLAAYGKKLLLRIFKKFPHITAENWQSWIGNIRTLLYAPPPFIQLSSLLEKMII